MTNRYQGVDPVLTSTALSYENDEYIADKIFKSFPVKLQTGKHFMYDKGKFRREASKRAAAAQSKEVTHNLTTGLAYACEDHALREFVTDEDRDNNVQEANDPYMDATENIMEKLKIDREMELAAFLTSSSVLTQYMALSGNSRWDNSNSDPITAIETGMQAIHSAVKKKANTLILGKQVYDQVKNHGGVLERIKYVQRAVTTEEILAELFGVEKIYVAGAGYNTANEGQTDTTGYIWGKNAVLCYIAPSVRPKLLTLGLTYTWKQLVVERLNGSKERDRRGQYVRVGDHYYDQNLVSAECGYLLQTVVS